MSGESQLTEMKGAPTLLNISFPDPSGKGEWYPSPALPNSDNTLAAATRLLEQAIEEQSKKQQLLFDHSLLRNWQSPLVFTPYVAPERESPDTLLAKADSGDASALVALGLLYEFGSGVPQDDKYAASLYQRGVDLGDPEAMCCLASLVETGRGVPTDPKLAKALFERASALLHPRAYCCLGVSYDQATNGKLPSSCGAPLSLISSLLSRSISLILFSLS